MFADFPAVHFEAWQAEVERNGKRTLAQLRTAPPGGLTLEPLYGPDPRRTILPMAPRAASPWRVAQEYAQRDPAKVAEALELDRELGLESSWLRLSPRIAAGTGDRSDSGIMLGGIADAERILRAAGDGVRLYVFAGAAGPLVADTWLAAAMAPDRLEGGVLGDPLGTLARHGSLGMSLAQAMAGLAEVTACTSSKAPRLATIVADGTPYHDAGAGVVEELAVTVATAIAYLRAGVEAGLDPESVATRMVVRFAADSDALPEIAKLRAARFLLRRVYVRSGVPAQAAEPWIVVRTGWRSRTQIDPWVNMLRGTVECFAAAIGGADEIAVQPMSEVIGVPTSDARRWALSTQHVLREESHLGRVIDPASGSWAIEALTLQVAEQAWARVRAIEAASGLAAALEAGTVQAWIRTTAAARAEALSRGQAALTGATLHPDLDEAAVRVDSDPFPPERSSDPIRDGWATLQARERPARVNALHVERLAAPYEGLRRKSDAHLAASGSRPVALAVPLGPATAHRFALQWVRHALTLGGFAVQPVTSAKLSTAPSAPVAVLCGSAEVLQTEAAALVPLLRNKGVLRILVTGVALPDIDGVLEPGGDLLATLQALQVVLNLD